MIKNLSPRKTNVQIYRIMYIYKFIYLCVIKEGALNYYLRLRYITKL